jgi:Glycosyltransferase family 10 (fucosyltransferase) C-term
LYSETVKEWAFDEDQVVLKELLANKSKLVAWFVTHCHTESKREDYVKELRKYIAFNALTETIDSYVSQC